MCLDHKLTRMEESPVKKIILFLGIGTAPVVLSDHLAVRLDLWGDQWIMILMHNLDSNQSPLKWWIRYQYPRHIMGPSGFLYIWEYLGILKSSLPLWSWYSYLFTECGESKYFYLTVYSLLLSFSLTHSFRQKHLPQDLDSVEQSHQGTMGDKGYQELESLGSIRKITCWDYFPT